MTMKKTFNKILSANDVGTTGGHQGGILIPKKEEELLAFLPPLDRSVKNPDAWLECRDENGKARRFRFVYYNNKLHDPAGTRNEYRITHMTGYFRDMGAREKDIFEISKSDNSSSYDIKIVSKEQLATLPTQAVRIKIRSGWQRIH
jgi:hypothetical protein